MAYDISNKIVHQTTVDIGNVRSEPQLLKITQGDTSYPVLAVKIVNGGQTYQIPEGSMVSLSALKPDGFKVFISAAGFSDDRNTVYFETTGQITAAAGRIMAVVQIAVPDGVGGTGVFSINVESNPGSDPIVSANDMAAFNDIKTQAMQAAAGMAQYRSDVSKALSTAKTAKATADLTDSRLDSLIVDGTPTEGNTELIDARTGYDGTAYDTLGTAIRSQVNELKGDLINNCVLWTPKKNIFNKDSNDKVQGYFVNYLYGHKNENIDYYAYILPIIAGKTISISGGRSTIQAGFVSEYTDLSALPLNYKVNGWISGMLAGSGIQVPSNATYLIISCHKFYINTVQVEYSEVETPYEPYKLVVPTVEETVKDCLDNYGVVEVGSGKQFTKLKDGIEYATQFKNYVVNVYDGVYDLVEEFGEELESSNGLVLKNGVHVIFSSKSKVVFNYTGSSSHVHTNFSPFNSGVGGFTIENLTLEASNCRYGVHDERGNSTDRYRNIYKNCNMSLDNSNNPDWTNPQNIGIGFGSDGYIEIDGCVFNNWITFHNNNGTQTSYRTEMIVQNCYFISGSVLGNSYGSGTDLSIIKVCNNSFSESPKITDGKNVKSYIYNNEIRTS